MQSFIKSSFCGDRPLTRLASLGTLSHKGRGYSIIHLAPDRAAHLRTERAMLSNPRRKP